jgi:hypothetical protein
VEGCRVLVDCDLDGAEYDCWYFLESLKLSCRDKLWLSLVSGVADAVADMVSRETKVDQAVDQANGYQVTASNIRGVRRRG